MKRGDLVRYVGGGAANGAIGLYLETIERGYGGRVARVCFPTLCDGDGIMHVALALIAPLERAA